MKIVIGLGVTALAVHIANPSNAASPHLNALDTACRNAIALDSRSKAAESEHVFSGKAAFGERIWHRSDQAHVKFERSPTSNLICPEIEGYSQLSDDTFLQISQTEPPPVGKPTPDLPDPIIPPIDKPIERPS